MINIGEQGKTTSAAVTGTAGSFSVTGPTYSNRNYVISSDVVIHIDRKATAAVATSFRLPVGEVARICCKGGDTISYIKTTGASDGTIWITQIE